MAGSERFPELHELVLEAIGALGERRVALGAGCSVTSLRAWGRRTTAHLTALTVEQTLPRLREWPTWLPVYQDGLEAITRLEQRSHLNWGELTIELRQRLDRAVELFSNDQIALGCEVSLRLVMAWRLGAIGQADRTAVIRALGHLRCLDGWPVESGDPAPDQNTLVSHD